MSVGYETLEKIDFVRKYAEYLDGGGVKKIDFNVAGQFIGIEITDYPAVRHWYFAIPEKKDLKEAVRYAVCEVGLTVTAVAKLKSGAVHCETFHGKDSVDGKVAWWLLGVDET